MSRVERKVLELLQKGQINPDQAADLMHSVSAGRQGGQEPLTQEGWLPLILNPFTRLPEVTGLVAAGLIAVGSLLVALVGAVRFDGALDVHVGGPGVSWVTALVDQLVAWPLVAVVFWGASRLIAREGRLRDFSTIAGVARLPPLMLGLLLAVWNPGSVKVFEQPAKLLAVSVVALFFLAWAVSWLYQGFKTASGLRGWSLLGMFVAALLVAEVASKVVLAAIPTASGPEPSHALPAQDVRDAEARARSFHQLLETGEFAKAHATFSSKMATALPIQELESTYRARQRKWGAFESIKSVAVSQRGDLILVDLTARYQNEKPTVRVVLDSDKSVAGLWFR